MAETKLDPQMEAYLKKAEKVGLPPIDKLTPQEARRIRNPFMKETGGPPEPVARVEDLRATGLQGFIPLRLYTPQGRGPFPILVYFHGGGWLLGDLETHDSLCRSLANRGSCVVALVDYSLAPEHPFPAAVEDAYAATRWISKHAGQISGDPSRIAVGGDSSGGNLAAVVCLIARERKEPALVFQLLVYPVMNLSSFANRSYKEYGDKYTLTRNEMEYIRRNYLKQEEEARNPYVSPLLAENLSNLPPALVITAECDVLTDEAKAYADRLKAAGVPVTYVSYEGLIHGFFRLGNSIDRAREALNSFSTVTF